MAVLTVGSIALLSDTGSSSTDKITSNPAVEGRGDANTLVTIREGGTTLGTAMTDSTGLWSFPPTSLDAGAHTLTATQTDLAGNTGSATLNFTYDKTPLPVVEKAYYVASDGSDSDLGTIEAPFATLDRAQTAMRNSSLKTTYIRAGTYHPAGTGSGGEALFLDAHDNGETWSYLSPRWRR